MNKNQNYLLQEGHKVLSNSRVNPPDSWCQIGLGAPRDLYYCCRQNLEPFLESYLLDSAHHGGMLSVLTHNQ